MRDFPPSWTQSAGRLLATALLALMPAAPSQALVLDPVQGTAVTPDRAGLGFAVRMERSPYRDVESRFDLMPLYLYEGKHVYLHSYRAGIRPPPIGQLRTDLFVAARLEGFPADSLPPTLQGMAAREPGVDVGIGLQHPFASGTLMGELRRDAANASDGTEARIGYWEEISGDRWTVTPYLILALRDSALNDYYYGVRLHEARADRAAYHAGRGVNTMLGINARYQLSDHWRAIGGVGVTRLASSIRDSPIVGNDSLLFVQAGLAYDFEQSHRPWQGRNPIIVKLLHGRSTDCNLLPVLMLHCTSINTVDRTSITAVEFGRPFVQRANGWPLDFVGYLGVLHHEERGLQPDSWQVNAYMKAYFYGFPWSDRVRTRLGFGAGVSYAARVPYVEARDQAARDRTTSKLLNYLDASVDVSLGDLIGSKRLTDTYVGVGASHRSGIFGASRLLSNVNGGSNYLYTYVETAF